MHSNPTVLLTENTKHELIRAETSGKPNEGHSMNEQTWNLQKCQGRERPGKKGNTEGPVPGGRTQEPWQPNAAWGPEPEQDISANTDDITLTLLILPVTLQLRGCQESGLKGM